MDDEGRTVRVLTYPSLTMIASASENPRKSLLGSRFAFWKGRIASLRTAVDAVVLLRCLWYLEFKKKPSASRIAIKMLVNQTPRWKDFSTRVVATGLVLCWGALIGNELAL